MQGRYERGVAGCKSKVQVGSRWAMRGEGICATALRITVVVEDLESSPSAARPGQVA